MNKKEVGGALRRGVLAGTLAGCVAGWASFATHSAAATMDPSTANIREDRAPAFSLPAVPDMPKLGAVPNVSVRAPAAVPAFAPLPALPAVTAPRTTTRTS